MTILFFFSLVFRVDNSFLDAPTLTKTTAIPEKFEAGIFDFSFQSQSLTNNTTSLLVMRIQHTSEGDTQYDYWLHYQPPILLNLSSYACQSVNVSAAVISDNMGPTVYSNSSSVWVHGGE